MKNYDILHEIKENIFIITFNKVNKCNSFDIQFIQYFNILLNSAIKNSIIKVILIKANGLYFSSGADINWIKNVINNNNLQDMLIFSKLLFTLYNSKKTTIAMVQGNVFGGGIGILAACDIVISSYSANFCFSETKIGLIPIIISPYIINAIGARIAKWLFITSTVFNAKQARRFNLIQYCVSNRKLRSFTMSFIKKIINFSKSSIKFCKILVDKQKIKPLSYKDLLSIYYKFIIDYKNSNKFIK